jgi:hypothetical protein
MSVSGGEILLLILAILVPLAIAIAVTLWTLQPAVIRNERAKRARKRSQAAPRPGEPTDQSPSPE